MKVSKYSIIFFKLFVPVWTKYNNINFWVGIHVQRNKIHTYTSQIVLEMQMQQIYK